MWPGVPTTRSSSPPAGSTSPAASPRRRAAAPGPAPAPARRSARRTRRPRRSGRGARGSARSARPAGPPPRPPRTRCRCPSSSGPGSMTMAGAEPARRSARCSCRRASSATGLGPARSAPARSQTRQSGLTQARSRGGSLTAGTPGHRNGQPGRALRTSTSGIPAPTSRGPGQEGTTLRRRSQPAGQRGRRQKRYLTAPAAARGRGDPAGDAASPPTSRVRCPSGMRRRRTGRRTDAARPPGSSTGTMAAAGPSGAPACAGPASRPATATGPAARPVGSQSSPVVRPTTVSARGQPAGHPIPRTSPGPRRTPAPGPGQAARSGPGPQSRGVRPGPGYVPRRRPRRSTEPPGNTLTPGAKAIDATRRSM